MGKDQDDEIDGILREIENKINAADYSEEPEEMSAFIASLTSIIVSTLVPDQIREPFCAILKPKRITGAMYENYSQYIRSPAGQKALRLLREAIDRFLSS